MFGMPVGVSHPRACGNDRRPPEGLGSTTRFLQAPDGEEKKHCIHAIMTRTAEPPCSRQARIRIQTASLNQKPDLVPVSLKRCQGSLMLKCGALGTKVSVTHATFAAA